MNSRARSPRRSPKSSKKGRSVIIDLVFVGKGADGNAVGLEGADLDPEVQAALEKPGGEAGGLFNEDDLKDTGEELEPNFSAAVLLWQNSGRARWRRRSAMPAASSSHLERVPHELVQAAREWARERRTRRKENRGCTETRPRVYPGAAATAGVAGRRRGGTPPPGSEVRSTGSGGVGAAGARATAGRAGSPPPPRRARLRRRAPAARAAQGSGSHHRGGVRGEEEAAPRDLSR